MASAHKRRIKRLRRKAAKANEKRLNQLIGTVRRRLSELEKRTLAKLVGGTR